MKCANCGGLVQWKGPIFAFTHSECIGCGAHNSHIPDDACDTCHGECIVGDGVQCPECNGTGTN